MKRIPVIEFLVQKKTVCTSEEAKRLIHDRRCMIDGRIILNPASAVPVHAEVRILPGSTPVSRGGKKLSGALDAFKISVEGKVCADLGSSTGGFTEVLLNRGAKRVYAIDTAKGELAWKLRDDARVEVWEGVNAARIEALPEDIMVMTIDISLVSLQDILPTAYQLLAPGGVLVTLIKPQYEVLRDKVPEGGVITDTVLQQEVCTALCDFSEELGFRAIGLMQSTVKGRSGNQEYLMVLCREK